MIVLMLILADIVCTRLCVLSIRGFVQFPQQNFQHLFDDIFPLITVQLPTVQHTTETTNSPRSLSFFRGGGAFGVKISKQKLYTPADVQKLHKHRFR